MIFIDPSELRESSNLLKYVSNVVYNPLPDLEAITGADVMISPDSLPLPSNDKLLQLHIDSGCKLLQLKFGHDLPTSVVDGRLNEALSRMLRTGANGWQCLLSFIGLLGYDQTNEMAMINGQLTYTKMPMRWSSVQGALTFWSERGGTLDFPLSSGKLIDKHFAIHQDHINRFASGEDTKEIWPKAPVFYNEIEPDNPYLKKWGIGQKIEVVEDIRVLLCAIPGVRIGPGKATAILEYMAENEIRQDFNGFLELFESKQLLEVPGIGKKLYEDIEWGLFRTYEERKQR